MAAGGFAKTVMPQRNSTETSTRQLKKRREDEYFDKHNGEDEIDEDGAIRGILPTSGTVSRNSSDHYVILGDLILPRPPPELKEQVERLERDLKSLDDRNMEGKLSNTFYLCYILLQVSGRAL
jgi:hypothetical protein